MIFRGLASSAFFAVAFCLHLSGSAFAGQATVSRIPAGSKVAGHIDFAQVKTLPACNAAVNWLFGNVGFVRKEGMLLRKSFGLNVPNDLDDLLLFADGFSVNANGMIDVSSAVSYIGGNIDNARLSNAISKAKGVQKAKAGSHDIVRADFSGGVYIAFPADGLVMLAASQASASSALGVFDAKAPSLSPTSPITAQFAIGTPVSLVVDAASGGKNLSVISGGILKADAKLITVLVTEKNAGTANVAIKMSFATNEEALLTMSTLNGLKLLCAFNSGKLPKGMVDSLMAAEIKAEGTVTTISVDFTAKDLSQI